MPHRHPVREIARQAGVSEATVDRVLHGRPGVREPTVLQVRQAIDDLDRQRTQLRLSGRQFLLDVVMETPRRFSALVRDALEKELPVLRPAVMRARYHVRDTWTIDEMVAELEGIARRGTHGVLLKAPYAPAISAAIGRLTAARIPVITYVTDIPQSTRVAHVGMDDRAAGATAAYLMSQWLRHVPGDVMVITSNEKFRGEGDRERGFRDAMRAADAARRVIEISGSDGRDVTCRHIVDAALRSHPDIVAVYSIGGGNDGIARAFADLGRPCAAFIGHDLGVENTDLLRSGVVSAVLHHDLRADMRTVSRVIMSAHGAIPEYRPRPSSIHIITPHNIPAS